MVPGASPRVHAAVLDGTLDDPRFVESFSLTTASTDPSEQAVDLARHLEPKVDGASHEAVGIRVASASPVARRSKASFSRAHCEGALIYVIRSSTGKPVNLVDSVTAPKSVGLKKEQLDLRVQSLVTKGVNKDAILAALVTLGRA